VLHRKKKKYRGVNQCGDENGKGKKEVNAVA
jgi:hypothetical protein